MAKIFSIVGTDTEIGKTYVTVEILNYLQKHSFSASALKPISAGITPTKDGMINEDVFKLSVASSVKLPSKLISPLALELPIAPHIAAKCENIMLNVNAVITKIKPALNLLEKESAYILIEGVGGIMVPLNANETYVDVLQAWQYPLILVVGMKLGCLNHTLLTYTTLLQHNINIVGWVANCIIEDMPYLDENIKFLKNYLKAPLLGIVAYDANITVTPEFKKVFRCN